MLRPLNLAVAEAIHQRLLLAAVDLDHRAVDEMRQIGSEVRDEAGDLLAFGDAPQRNAARGKRIGLLARDIFMSRAIASTRPAQRSVRTGPGLTARKLILSLPYCAASASVRFCPAAFAAPGAISQYEDLTPSLPIRLTTRPPARLSAALPGVGGYTTFRGVGRCCGRNHFVVPPAISWRE